MKLSREKVLHISHLILGHLDRDVGVEYFDEPQEIRQTIVKIIMDDQCPMTDVQWRYPNRSSEFGY